MLVIFAHTQLPFMPGGFIGVDVFFVLSGYFITALLHRELETTNSIAIIQFYARRLKRLLPALAFMVVVSVCLALSLLSEGESRAQLASSPFAITWVSNIYFSLVTFDYFDELANKDLFLHTWSLGVEEQFYLIWPTILLLLFWLTRKANNHFKTNPRIMFYGMFFAFISSLSLSLYLTTHFPEAAFYQMPSRIWQFSLGAIVFYFLQGRGFNNKLTSIYRYKSLLYSLQGIGLTLIIGSGLVMHPNLSYPGFLALIPSLGAALIILTGKVSTKELAQPLSHPLLVWIGDRSYSLYLWHWPILTIGFSLGFQGEILPTLAMLIISILAASISYRFIELPFWKGCWSKTKPKQVILLSLLIMVSIAALMYHGLRQPPQQPTPSIDKSQQWRSDLPLIYRLPCDAWYKHSRVEPCVFNAENSTKTVVLFADSIGAQWFSAIPAIFTEPLWKVIVLTKSSCPIVDEDFFYTRIKRVYKVCSNWRDTAIEEIIKIKPDVIIIGNSAANNFTKTQLLEGSSRILNKLHKITSAIFIIPGTPNLGFDGPGCVARHISPKGHIDINSCITKGRTQHIKPVIDTLKQASNRFSNVHILNLNNLVCPKGSCNAISTKGHIVFRDGQHLTDTFVKSQVPFIRKKIELIYDGLKN